MIVLKKNLLLVSVLCVASAFAQMKLDVFKKINGVIDENRPLGYLMSSDMIKELPIPKDRIEHESYVDVQEKVRDKNGKIQTVTQKQRVVTYEEVEPKAPPRYVPVNCKFGDVWVKRSELDRFMQEYTDLSGEYVSETGRVILKSSPSNASRFNIIVQNGKDNNIAEIEMGNLEKKNINGHARFIYKEDGCSVGVDVFNRVVRVAQHGCESYNSGEYTLAGNYPTFRGNNRIVETFNFDTYNFTYPKYLWCASGYDTCEPLKDEHGVVNITWSKDGRGTIERKAGNTVHTYRAMERVIPHKRDYFMGEKPIALKTKRTDMSGEWMNWYFYPRAGRFKMMRSGMRYDAAYMEIYEPVKEDD